MANSQGKVDKMQQAKQATFRQYVLAGNTLAAREQILVSTHVNLENPGEQDNRELYIAKGAAKRNAGVSYQFAAIVLAVCILLGFVALANKNALTRRMNGEYAQLNARYQAAQAEEQRLLEVYNAKSDASAICYYAVQSLGMRLAGQQETIGVQAASIPHQMYTQNMMGSASSSGH